MATVCAVRAVGALSAVGAVIGGHLRLCWGGMRRDVVVVVLRVVVHGESPIGANGYSPPVCLKVFPRSIRSGCR